MITRRRLAGLAVSGVAAKAGIAAEVVRAPARAQAKVTRMIVAFPPGGPVDLVARLIAEPMSKELGHSVIVENKPGANSIIGAEATARAAPDGATVFLSSIGPIVLNPFLYETLPYDPDKDFAPVSLVISSPTMLVVNPAHPAKDAAEFVAAAKAAGKERPMPVATTGNGSTTHLAMELFMERTGVTFLHVPYKGAAPAIADVVNGQVPAFFGDLPGVVGQIQGGKLRALGFAAPAGHPSLPGVKTLKEQGVPVDECVNWYGLLAPGKTPAEIIVRLNKAVHVALATPAVRDKLIASGADVIPTTPEAMKEAIAVDRARWGRLIKAKGIKAE